MKKRNTPLPKFKYNIGDTFTNFDRNLEIIDRKYVQKEELNYRTGNIYIANKKYYKYKCNKCGNEDWILEYCLGDKMHINCNACCVNARKLVVGINDITTTAPWMVKYFKDGKDEAAKYFKYSKEKIEMVCPDCGRTHISSPLLVFNSKNLTCPCQDGWSYPNKFMYSVLEQLGLDFETEKKFDWSQGRLYDNYIEYNELKIITEQHGNQHYNKQFNKYSRTVEEERENDKLKEFLAKENGITNYIVLDCRKSELEYIKKSIISSNLLLLFNKTENDIDWNKCAEFATNNLAKMVCDFKKQNINFTLHEIAKRLHLSYIFVLRSVKTGSKLGWCTYNTSEDIEKILKRDLKITNQRPIFCKETGMYYRCTRTFVDDYFEKHGKKLCERNIRYVCLGKRNHVNNMTFLYITQEQFNSIKDANPKLVVGNYFKLKQ